MASSKVVVVTGANKGIGIEIARRLARNPQFHVILCSRSLEAGQAAAAEIGNGATAMQLDIESDDSVGAFVAAMQPNIWALVNNAGMAFKGDAFDENVARTTLSCNYYGTERITSALLPLIHPEGHVINVSSRAGLLKILSPTLQQRFLSEDLTCSGISALCGEFATAVGDGSFKQKGWPETCYGTSKIAMSALTRVIARLNPKLHVNAVCPGWCKTDMAANDAVQAGSGRQRLPQKEPTRLASALFLHEIRCHRVLSLRQVCFLLESNTTSTGKFFAERAEISWTDASF